MVPAVAGDNVPGNKVLIVEDEKLLAMMLEDLLLDAGHRVVRASSLGDALALVHTPFVFPSASDADGSGPNSAASN